MTYLDPKSKLSASLSAMLPPGRILVDRAERRAIVGADVTLAGLDAQLVRHGLWLPVDGPAEAELGMLVARDSTGPLRVGFGGWTWVLLSAEAVGAGGKSETAGMEIVGSGREVLAVECRLAARPEAAMAVRVHPDVVVTDVRPRPQWVVMTRSALWLGYLGSEAEVGEAQAAFDQVSKAVVLRQSPLEDAAMRRRLWVVPEVRGARAARIHVPPEMFRAAILRAKIFEWVADPMHGTLLVAVPAERWGEVARAVDGLGGRAEEWG